MQEENKPIPFQGFNPYGEVRIYEHGILPHWRQDECTYFVTFRLADSLPQSVLQKLEEERIQWFRKAGIDPTKAGWKQHFAKLPPV